MEPYKRTPLDHPDVQPFRWEGRPPACLLLHGLTSTPWEVRPVGLALREAGFHAESLWLPGHGTRPEDLAEVSWEAWAAAVTERYDRMVGEHGEVAVLGTSLGGTLALWLAAERAVAAVVSMGGAVRLNRAARLARLVARFRPYQAKRPQGSAIFDDEARLRHPSYHKTPLRAIAQMDALTRQLRPRLPEIEAPLLVMHARLDTVIAPENAIRIYEGARSEVKKLLWLERSDHIITEDVEHPIVTREAVAWIEMVAGRGKQQSG